LISTQNPKDPTGL